MDIKRIVPLLSLLGVSVVHASIIPTLSTVTGTGPFTWNYTVNLDANQNAVPGPTPGASTPSGVGVTSGTNADYFTIYDFAGFTGVHSEPAGWGFQSLAVGSTPSDVVPTDNPAIVNLTWYRTGTTLLGPQTPIGTFSAQSTLGAGALVSYTSSGTRNSGASAGTTVSSIGTVLAPVGTVPEPASFGLLGMSLVSLGMIRRKFAARR